MKSRAAVLVLLSALAVGLGTALPAGAIAVVDSYFLGCGNFASNGTTTAPYLVVEVYDPNLGVDMVFAAFPTPPGGTFYLNPTWGPSASGTFLEAWVWGSPTNDPDDWDGEEYFFVEGPCLGEPVVAIPTLDGIGAGISALLLLTVAIWRLRRSHRFRPATRTRA